jgi:hypothetical protein
VHAKLPVACECERKNFFMVSQNENRKKSFFCRCDLMQFTVVLIKSENENEFFIDMGEK